MRKILLAVVVLTILNNVNLFAQQKTNNTAFEGGEKLRFVASYYMSGMWTDLAEITMEVSELKTSSKELYRLKCVASTYKSWDSYFKIRDLYETYVDQNTLAPYIFKRNINEGGYSKSIKYVYKWKSKMVNATIQRQQDPEYTIGVDITDDTHDLVSVIYKIRNIDFSKKYPGDIIKQKVLIDAAVETVTLKYGGVETINVGDYGKKRCYKLTVSLKDDEILKGKDANNIWFTADKNKIPVLIKAEIPVGSIQMRLSEMNGLRN